MDERKPKCQWFREQKETAHSEADWWCAHPESMTGECNPEDCPKADDTIWF